MYTHVILIADRYAPMDNKHWVRCESLERARIIKREYERGDRYYAEIFELGKSID